MPRSADADSLYGVTQDLKRGAFKARINFLGKEHFIGR